MQGAKKHPVRTLLVLCYLVWFIGLQLVHLIGFISNRVLYASGSLVTEQVTVNDFAWNDIVEKDGKLITTGADPQLVLLDTERRVDTVIFRAKYAKDPRLVAVFWAKRGQGHSLRKMAYPQSGSENSLFHLSAFGVQNVRIDPGTVAGNEIEVLEITLNAPRPWYSFFAMSASNWLFLLLVPGLAASGIWVTASGLQFYRKGRNNNG